MIKMTGVILRGGKMDPIQTNNTIVELVMHELPENLPPFDQEVFGTVVEVKDEVTGKLSWKLKTHICSAYEPLRTRVPKGEEYYTLFVDEILSCNKPLRCD